MSQSPTLFFKRSHFSTHLPVDCRYTRSHFWARRMEGDRLRIGLTRFATRMLGEMVDHRFDAAPQSPVRPGDVVGWLEGFKAISDLVCVASGTFAGGNPALAQDITLVSEKGYNEGWLYEVEGELDAQSLDVHGYADYLQLTIDKMLEKQGADYGAEPGTDSPR